ncbi:hypothetical protein [Denitromonas iodatirespirans]|uniref:Uncharacterized protein n=1 Tax=Denitromonas iodatirespirans TaxID=2795389 RepID=A0A944D8Z0_DENI1|nr:hypothetical protein [Denitromonas iodatirespirans]MBT0960546.1 hypothetical protein [Denitromonas iodatirespirans]
MSAALPPTEAFGRAVCSALRAQAAKIGICLGNEPTWPATTSETREDPFSRAPAVVVTWRGGPRFGTATFFADGRVFADYQVLAAHPTRPDYYVEAVQVWGSADALRGDAVIVAQPA